MRYLATAAVLAVLSAPVASAEYDYAPVVRVEPIYKTVTISTPRRVCREEEVRHRGSSDSHTGTILGAIVGGVIGNEISDGRHVGSIAGAALGASIGHDLSRDDDDYITTESRCRTRQVRSTEERLQGYRVTYRYEGKTYTTKTDHDPGNEIRVRVDVNVRPAE